MFRFASLQVCLHKHCSSRFVRKILSFILSRTVVDSHKPYPTPCVRANQGSLREGAVAERLKENACTMKFNKTVISRRLLPSR